MANTKLHNYIIKLIGIIQIIGGISGLVVVILIYFSLSITSMVAGIQIIRKTESGFILSFFIQVLQIPRINIIWICYKFYLMFSFFITYEFPNFVNYYSFGSVLLLTNYIPSKTIIGINIFSLLILLILTLIYKKNYTDQNITELKINALTILHRIYAVVFDYGLIYCLVYFYIKSFGKPNAYGGFEVEGFLHIFILLSIWIIYFPLLESIFGFTPGKGLFGLRVLQSDGKRLNFIKSLKRHIFDLIDFILLGLIAIYFASFSKGYKRLGDKCAGSEVILRKNLNVIK